MVFAGRIGRIYRSAVLLSILYEFNINLSTANIKQTPLLAQERMQKVARGTQQFNESIVPRAARKVNFRAFLCLKSHRGTI